MEPFELELPLLALVPPLDPAEEPELVPAPAPEPAPPPPLWAKTGAQIPRVPSAASKAVRRVNLVFEWNGEFIAQHNPPQIVKKWGAALTRAWISPCPAARRVPFPSPRNSRG
jgi:hypothetical protein